VLLSSLLLESRALGDEVHVARRKRSEDEAPGHGGQVNEQANLDALLKGNEVCAPFHVHCGPNTVRVELGGAV
jgi:hypothetical protein